MNAIATFTKREELLFYVRFLFMLAICGYALNLYFFDEYGESGTYRLVVPMVAIGSMTYVYLYGAAIRHLRRTRGAFIWSEKDRLYWLTDILGSFHIKADIKVDINKRSIVELRSGTGSVKLKLRRANEPSSEIERRLIQQLHALGERAA